MEWCHFVMSAAGETLAVRQNFQLAGILRDAAAVDESYYDAGDVADHANSAPTQLEAHWQQKLALGAGLEYWALEEALEFGLALVKDCYYEYGVEVDDEVVDVEGIAGAADVGNSVGGEEG